MSGKGVALDYATALSTSLEGILYGFSVFMFGATAYALIRRRLKSGEKSYVMLTTACLFLVFSTMHMGMDIHRLIDGFILHRDTLGGPASYFGDVGSFTWFFRNLIYTLQTLLGDGVVIYRCYVAWDNFWVVILPVMLWLTTLVTASILLGLFAHAHNAANHTSVFGNQVTRWVTAFFSSSLAANVLSTGFLAFRLWNVDRQVTGIRSTEGPLRHFTRVVLDSGAIYSVTLTVIIILFVSKSNIQSIIMDMTMPIISICFYTIILRIALYKPNSRFASSIGSSNSRAHISALSSSSRDAMRMQHLEVHLNKVTDVVSDSKKTTSRLELEQEHV